MKGSTVHLMTEVQGDKNICANFLIIGAQKSATTSIQSILSNHPQVFMPARKELHYFDKDYNFVAAAQSYEQYNKHFDLATTEIAIGEATPSYLYWNTAAQRIAAYNPRIKLVVSLRDPIARAYSHWNMQRHRGNEKLGFDEAIELEKSRLESVDLTVRDRQKFSYIDRGRYATQLERFLDHFPKQQIFVRTAEYFSSNSERYFRELSEFLRVSSVNLNTDIVLNQNSYDTEISRTSYNRIWTELQDERSKLVKLFGLDLSEWSDKAS